MNASQVTIASKGFFFLEKAIFLQNRILKLSDEIVPVKELQVQSSLKKKLLQGHVSKIWRLNLSVK